MTADCKFCQNLQSAKVAINTIQLTITRGAIEIKPSMPWGGGWLKTEISDFICPLGRTGGGGGWLKTFHRVSYHMTHWDSKGPLTFGFGKNCILLHPGPRRRLPLLSGPRRIGPCFQVQKGDPMWTERQTFRNCTNLTMFVTKAYIAKS